MKTFICQCGNSLHFENSQCLACGRQVGYLPDEQQLSALDTVADDVWQATHNNRQYRQCKNYSDYDVCNWMVPAEEEQVYCASCRLNHIIPNLAEPHNLKLWYRIEQAKRRLLYTLFSLKLPVVSRAEDPQLGMAFEFLQDETEYDEFSNELTIKNRVVTGHNAGLITINLLEAEDSSRVQMRESMNERYRTLLGHFRHESGHYFWERLIHPTENLESFRETFGNEQADYQLALKSYYNDGPPDNWQDHFISAYASMHPWEDWAESWAHYLHMADTLETAHDFGFRIHGYEVSQPAAEGQLSSGYMTPVSFDDLFEDWCRLSVAMNALNRSMGMEDAYPFVISSNSLDKLRYVHAIVSNTSG